MKSENGVERRSHFAWLRTAGLIVVLGVSGIASIAGYTSRANAADSLPVSTKPHDGDHELRVLSPTNTAPVVTNPGSVQTECEVELQLEARDVNEDSLTWTAENLHPGLSISQTGLVSGTIEGPGGARVSVRVNDGLVDSSSIIFWWDAWACVSADGGESSGSGSGGGSRAPQIVYPGSQSSECNAPVSLQLEAVGPDGNSLTWSAENLHPGLSISQEGLISGAITQPVGSRITVSATDGQFDAAPVTFWWDAWDCASGTGSNTGNGQPQLTYPDTQTTECNTPVSVQLNATDPDDDALTWSALNLHPGLSIDQTGLISGQITEAGGRSIEVLVNDGTMDSGTIRFWWGAYVCSSTPDDGSNAGGDPDSGTTDFELTVQEDMSAPGSLYLSGIARSSEKPRWVGVWFEHDSGLYWRNNLGAPNDSSAILVNAGDTEVSWFIRQENLPAGRYTVQVESVDEANGTALATLEVQVAPHPDRPTLDLVSPPNAMTPDSTIDISYVTNIADITVAGIAVRNEAGLWLTSDGDWIDTPDSLNLSITSSEASGSTLTLKNLDATSAPLQLIAWVIDDNGVSSQLSRNTLISLQP